MAKKVDPLLQPPERSPSAARMLKPRGTVVIARVVGILCVASGFILGIHGLDSPGSPMLPTALGLILTGVIAQVFALVRSCYAGSQGNG